MSGNDSRAHQKRVYVCMAFGVLCVGILLCLFQTSPEERQFYLIIAFGAAVTFGMKAAVLVPRSWSRSSHPHRIGLYACIILWVVGGAHVLSSELLGPEKTRTLLGIAYLTAAAYAVPFLSHVRRHIVNIRARKAAKRTRHRPQTI